jgi:hypothetical protein
MFKVNGYECITPTERLLFNIDQSLQVLVRLTERPQNESKAKPTQTAKPAPGRKPASAGTPKPLSAAGAPKSKGK